MSIQEELTSADRNIGAELDDLAQKVVDVSDPKDFGARKHALGKYFSLIRYAHAYGIYPNPNWMTAWGIGAGR